ncbi:hypothetical protein NSQ51_15170 [Geobacillus sp. FSL K6-0789]|uniref:Uncharacterized protein n=1 Tax=Geobacillus stearothermophilus TaxID=1422 RepID=A0A3L7D5I1_GEOSE|nr:hypothetical protein [Geobacillus stearothermophilus]MED3665494.1 hypothetical protein [Geobacillus stearothermophilus]RLQ05078.1 hypothetical protein D9549_15415 [Geobacillus stearothermophilus]RLQ05477.1 hypothetical protein D9547_14965 [Geobacillus stearothermophilus]RLQ12857.1 hypothetical protein D9548_15240 [Geobacillus stearothermophilus]
MKVLDSPVLESVRPFISDNTVQLYQSLNEHQAFYMLDNMILTKLRKQISNLPLLLQAFHQSPVFLIPDVVLEESFRNIPTKERYNNYYFELFKQLSAKKQLYIISMETIYQLEKGMTKKQYIFDAMKQLALEAFRVNRDIINNLERCELSSFSDLPKLRQIILHNGNNAGERFICFFSLLLVHQYYGPAYICSDDGKGVYTMYNTFVNNESLFRILGVDDFLMFKEQYILLSYDRILQLSIQNTKLSSEEIYAFVHSSGRNESRKVIYSLDGQSFHTEIKNANFAKWIEERKIEIFF